MNTVDVNSYIAQQQFSEEAEQAIVGGMIANPEIIPDIIKRIETTDFFINKNRLLFRMLKTLHEDKVIPDIITIKNYLIQYPNSELKIDYLIDIMTGTWTATNAIMYCQFVKKYSLARQYTDNLNLSIERINAGQDIEDIIEMNQKHCDKLIDSNIEEQNIGTLDDFLATADEVQILLKLFVKNSRTMIYSSPNKGKSYLSLVLACLLQKESQDVIYFDNENRPSQILSWVRDWQIADDMKDKLLYAHHYVKTIEDIVKLNLKSKIIFVDSLIRFYPKINTFSENNATDMRAIDEHLSELVEQGNTVVVLHHARKDNESYRGSTDISAMFDVIYKLEREEAQNFKEKTDLLLKLEKTRYGKLEGWQLSMCWVDDRLVDITFMSEQNLIQQRMDNIDTIVERLALKYIPQGYNTMTKLRDIIREDTGKGSNVVFNALKRLRDAGKIDVGAYAQTRDPNDSVI